MRSKKELAQMHQDIEEKMAQSIKFHQQNTMSNLMFDAYGGEVQSKPRVYGRSVIVENHSRVISYPGGYWAKINITDGDHVQYRLFNSGWLAKTFHKIGFRKVIDGGWDSVKQRDNIEATLGATYMAIDAAIAEDIKKKDHRKFLKEMIKTDPDNLKAIAQLDMLDKGDGPGSSPPVLNGANQGMVSGSNIIGTSTGNITKANPNKPASVRTGSVSFAAGGANGITFGDSSEEVIKVDSKGDISFGDRMAKAIREAAQTEQGEINGT